MKLVLCVVLLVFLSGSDSSRLPYIIRGSDAEIGEFPFQVSLQYGKGKHFCGGVLIDELWVLTAAHCVTEKKVEEKGGVKGISAVVGLHDWGWKQGGPRRYKAADIILGDFNWVGFVNDIALVKLEKPVDVSSQYRGLISLPDSYDELDENDCMISGWGKIQTQPQSRLPKVLQKAAVQVDNHSVKECARLREKYGKGQLCVMNKRTRASSCSGDSGGPLICRSRRSGDYKLAGLTSNGRKICEQKKYAVYMSVPYYRGWIKQHTGV